EGEGAYREGYVDANGSDGNDPCAVDRDWENSLTRALLAARKGEGCDCNCKPAAPGHTHGEAASDAN
ncbi:MAG TPA: hypothetical protein VMX15_06385, partial [Candidatus Heimdallarchaeota archaeon]|nr:hypothetical protein [Candidatus Heimdallarchaeota archaeon]